MILLLSASSALVLDAGRAGLAGLTVGLASPGVGLADLVVGLADLVVGLAALPAALPTFKLGTADSCVGNLLTLGTC